METKLTNIAKLVRKALKASGVKARVLCSASSQSETMRIRVSSVSAALAIHPLDNFDGLINSEKAYSNAVISFVAGLVAQHVASVEGFRFVFVSFEGSQP